MDPVLSYWVKGDCVTKTSQAFLTRDALTSLNLARAFIERDLLVKQNPIQAQRTKKPLVYTISPLP